jgi:hypothetical protein
MFWPGYGTIAIADWSIIVQCQWQRLRSHLMRFRMPCATYANRRLKSFVCVQFSVKLRALSNRIRCVTECDCSTHASEALLFHAALHEDNTLFACVAQRLRDRIRCDRSLKPVTDWTRPRTRTRTRQSYCLQPMRRETDNDILPINNDFAAFAFVVAFSL